MTDLNFHLLLAVIVGATLVLLPLLAGLFVRPRLPTSEKDAVYECGEPTIGSSYIQFDLRFYVVALLFIIFDVEVVFFFPWGTIFGGEHNSPIRRSPKRPGCSYLTSC
ncbi:MAG: NADH-quinone oxidoreductase subunit A [Planctomycetaceae bacterium]